MIDPFLGINSPVRLLREQWKDPTALAQELYAMFTAKGPREINDTLTIRVGAGKPALRIIHDDGDTIINEGPTHQFGITKETTATSTAVPGRKPRPRPSDDSRRGPQQPQFSDDSSRRQQQAGTNGDHRSPSRPFGSVNMPTPASTQSASQSLIASSVLASPMVEFDVPARFSQPVVFDQPVFTSEPLFVNQTTGRVQTLNEVVAEQQHRNPREDWLQLGGSSGTPAYFGTVLSGSGSSWTVTLFASGASGAIGSVVPVTIPYILDTETAPVGVTVGPIFLIGGTYIYQPPVWLE